MCGGLAVALGLRPRKALLNDRNPHAVNFYLQIQRGLTNTLPMRNERRLYDEYRCRFNELVRVGRGDTAEAALLFYYLLRTCYNGLCRFNSRGEFNVPFGRHSTINYAADFETYRGVFQGWRFTAGDFERLPLRRDDVVYADPPYDVEFTRYAAEDFRWDDQVRLAEWLSGHSGIVILSNQATDRIVRLYRKLGFRLSFLWAPRFISCNGDRTPAREVLATKGL